MLAVFVGQRTLCCQTGVLRQRPLAPLCNAHATQHLTLSWVYVVAGEEEAAAAQPVEGGGRAETHRGRGAAGRRPLAPDVCPLPETLADYLQTSKLHDTFWHPGTLGKQPWIIAAWSSKQIECAPNMHGMCTTPQLVKFQQASIPSTHSAVARPVVDQSTLVSLKPAN